MSTDTVEAVVVDVDLTLEAEDEEPCYGARTVGCPQVAVVDIVNDPCGCHFHMCRSHADKSLEYARDHAPFFGEQCRECVAFVIDVHQGPLR